MDINGQLSKNGWVKGAETAKYYTYYKNIDDTNIKVVTDDEDNALFMSRSPIPHPKY